MIPDDYYPLLIISALIGFVLAVHWIYNSTAKAEAAMDQWYTKFPEGQLYQPKPETEIPKRADEGCAPGMIRPTQTMVRFNNDGNPTVSLGEGLPTVEMPSRVYRHPDTGVYFTDWMLPNGRRVIVQPVVKAAS